MKKQNKKKSIVGLTAFFIMLNGIGYSPFVYAQGGDKIGGGGDVLTCKVNGKTNYYLLDMYEALQKGIKPDLGGAKLNIEQKVELAAQIYADIDPIRAAQYLQSAKKMLADVVALEKGEAAPNKLVMWSTDDRKLKDIDDSDEVYEYAECEKNQLVRQDDGIDAEAPFVIYRPLFSLLDDDQKVATIYHEVIYRDFRSNGAKVSRNARYLNRHIISNQIQKISQKQYVDFLRENRLNTYKVAGQFETLLDSSKIVYDANDNIKLLNGNFNFNVGKMTFLVQNPTIEDNMFVQAQTSGTREEKNGVLSISSEIKGELPIGGLLKVDSNLTVSLTGVRKWNDLGGIDYILDLDGKILSRAETGRIRKELSPAFKDALRTLYGCLKPIAKKDRNIMIVQSFLEKSRSAIAADDLNQLNLLNEECERDGNTSLVSNISETAKELQKWLAIKKHRYGELIFCSGAALSAHAGLIFAGTAQVETLTCTFKDGTRRVYAGVGLALGVGVGAAIGVGKVIFDVNKQFMYADGGIMNGAVALLPPNMDVVLVPGFAHATGYGFEGGGVGSKQYRFGLMAGFIAMGGDVLFRIGKKKDDYNRLIDVLVKSVVVTIQ